MSGTARGGETAPASAEEARVQSAIDLEGLLTWGHEEERLSVPLLRILAALYATNNRPYFKADKVHELEEDALRSKLMDWAKKHELPRNWPESVAEFVTSNKDLQQTIAWTSNLSREVGALVQRFGMPRRNKRAPSVEQQPRPGLRRGSPDGGDRGRGQHGGHGFEGRDSPAGGNDWSEWGRGSTYLDIRSDRTGAGTRRTVFDVGGGDGGMLDDEEHEPLLQSWRRAAPQPASKRPRCETGEETDRLSRLEARREAGTNPMHMMFRLLGERTVSGPMTVTAVLQHALYRLSLESQVDPVTNQKAAQIQSDLIFTGKQVESQLDAAVAVLASPTKEAVRNQIDNLMGAAMSHQIQLSGKSIRDIDLMETALHTLTKKGTNLVTAAANASTRTQGGFAQTARGMGRGGGKPPQKGCWVCGGPHYAAQCAKGGGKGGKGRGQWDQQGGQQWYQQQWDTQPQWQPWNVWQPTGQQNPPPPQLTYQGGGRGGAKPPGV